MSKDFKKIFKDFKENTVSGDIANYTPKLGSSAKKDKKKLGIEEVQDKKLFSYEDLSK